MRQRVRRPRIFPIFRSESQARLLAHLVLTADGETRSIQEIASATKIPASTVHREIDRLESAGIVSSVRFATARIVRVNRESPTYDDLRSIVLKTYGPPELVAGRLSEIDGVEEAFMFGSWAARAAGEDASFPRDVDVLVVGAPDALELDVAAAELSELLGQDVQMTVVSVERWQRGDSGFLKTVKNRPHLRVLPDDDR